MTADELLLGIRDFIYFIASPQLQEILFPVKIVFIFCSLFFLFFIVYFMVKSSWAKFYFLEDIVEFFSWKSLPLIKISNRWEKLLKRFEKGIEAECKLVVIEAEDLLIEALENEGYKGENFEELVKNAGKLFSSIYRDLIWAHGIRNAIVYDPNFKTNLDELKKVLDIYYSALSAIGQS